MSDIALPNGVVIRVPVISQDQYDRDEVLEWTKAIRERGLLLKNVPEEFSQRVYAELCAQLDSERSSLPQ